MIDERGMIVRVNKIALDILGYTAEELIGKWYNGTVIAEDLNGRTVPNIDRPITEVFLTGKTVFRKVYYRRKVGPRVPVALTVSPVLFDDKPIGAIEVFRDITEELQLEHAKDEFISIASHQLRTPATVVKQYLGMILDGYVGSPKEQMDMVRVAYTHNNNQLDIINDLLKVAQVEANKLATNFKQTDLVGLLETIVSGQQPEFKKRNITLELTYPKSPITVCMDPLHIQMVLENIINNANKYSPPDTTVCVVLSEAPSSVTVTVADQGIGIAPEDIPKLFNKFSRIENATSTASGTGLGLYWAKKLVELYNGKITLKSELHKGSTFSVILPSGASA